jgi:hypothetical protein
MLAQRAIVVRPGGGGGPGRPAHWLLPDSRIAPAPGYAFKRVAVKYNINADDGLAPVPQETKEGELSDTEDRVEFGVRLLADLHGIKG